MDHVIPIERLQTLRNLGIPVGGVVRGAIWRGGELSGFWHARYEVFVLFISGVPSAQVLPSATLAYEGGNVFLLYFCFGILAIFFLFSLSLFLLFPLHLVRFCLSLFVDVHPYCEALSFIHLCLSLTIVYLFVCVFACVRATLWCLLFLP